MFYPVLAEAWKYSYPFFLAKAIASAESTSFERTSHLLPTSITTESLVLTPLLFIIPYHLLILLKLSLFSKSKIRRITCASSKKGLRIY
jgi:hypothetical protein